MNLLHYILWPQQFNHSNSRLWCDWWHSKKYYFIIYIVVRWQIFLFHLIVFGWYRRRSCSWRFIGMYSLDIVDLSGYCHLHHEHLWECHCLTLTFKWLIKDHSYIKIFKRRHNPCYVVVAATSLVLQLGDFSTKHHAFSFIVMFVNWGVFEKKYKTPY